MGDMVEPDINPLAGKVVNEDTEMPVGNEPLADQPDEGDEASKPEDFDG